MRKLLIIVAFSFLILRFISSCATQQIFEQEVNKSSDSDIKYDLKGLNLIININPFDLNILPPSSGVQFYNDGIIFLSLSKNEGKMLPKHLSFGIVQAYYATLEDTILGQHMPFSPSTAFSYPCDAITFGNGYNTMYFTKYCKTDDCEKIYHAKFSSGGNDKKAWLIDPQPVSFCTERATYSHPSLSTDGRIIIFASDNSRTVGGMDLFLTKKEDDKWTDPENLGDIINTKGNELFPFLDEKNNLFFSSNGLSGYGGYDIFISKYNGERWEEPTNLTKNINSSNDEFAFIVNPRDGMSAFFTTRKKSQIGEMQLYRVSLKGKIIENDSLILSDVLYSLSLADNESNELRNTTKKLRSEKMKTDSLNAAKIKNERIRASRLVEDSIKATRIEAERIKTARLKADSIEATRIEAERAKTSRLKADSIEAARIEAYRKVNNEIVIYKVQVFSSIRPKGTYEISINGDSYTTFEYFYLDEYRYTIGEFNSLKPAVELQNACRNAGYPQAFVIAFRNNIRINDLELFKE
jgi:hypothetical protein